MNASRVPRGVPTGGRFAETARDESDVDLGVDSDELTPEQMVVHARKSASHHMKSVAMSSSSTVDDVAQETMYAALKARSNDPSIIITPGYLHSVARAQANVVRRGLLNQRDYKAAGILSKHIRQAREAGVEPTSQQIADWATEIRMSTPVKHRPSADFAELMQVTEVPLDSTVDAESAHVDMDTVEWSAPVVAGLEAVGDQPTRRELDAVRSDVWSYLGTGDTPRPIPDSMSWKRTSAVKQAVEDEGGVLRVVERWNAGERPAAGHAILSLFAPKPAALPYVPAEPVRDPGYEQLDGEDKRAADKAHASALRARARAQQRREKAEDLHLRSQERLAEAVFPTFLRHPDYAERLLAAALSSARR